MKLKLNLAERDKGTRLRDLFIHEIGHAVAAAHEGAALSRITLLGDTAHCQSFIIDSSGPQPLPLETDIAVVPAGAAFSFALCNIFEDLPLAERLRAAPASLQLMAICGIAENDLASLGGTTTTDIAKASVLAFLTAAVFRQSVYGLATKNRDDFRAGKAVHLLGNDLRKNFPLELPAQLATIYHQIDTPEAMAKFAADIESGQVLPVSLQPMFAGLAGPEDAPRLQ